MASTLYIEDIMVINEIACGTADDTVFDFAHAVAANAEAKNHQERQAALFPVEDLEPGQQFNALFPSMAALISAGVVVQHTDSLEADFLRKPIDEVVEQTDPQPHLPHLLAVANHLAALGIARRMGATASLPMQANRIPGLAAATFEGEEKLHPIGHPVIYMPRRTKEYLGTQMLLAGRRSSKTFSEIVSAEAALQLAKAE